MSERKAAVVTGSTSGIGLGVATAFAKAGVYVMLNGLGRRRRDRSIRAKLAADTGVTVGFNGANLMQNRKAVRN